MNELGRSTLALLLTFALSACSSEDGSDGAGDTAAASGVGATGGAGGASDGPSGPGGATSAAGGAGATSSGGVGGGAGGGVEPLGTVVAADVACEKNPLPGSACKELVVTCPGVADMKAVLDIVAPQGSAVGTIVFTPGGGGTERYAAAYIHGADLVTGAVAAGFATVQVRWPDATHGFLEGPGGARALACRYATVAAWLHDNVHGGGAANPFCATGNSGGAGQIAYALSYYGLDSLFDMVLLTGGPPFGRIDQGCLCDPAAAVPNPCGVLKPQGCYEDGAAGLIDATYGDTSCSAADVTKAAALLADSLVTPDATLAYPKTDVKALFGAQDDTVAVPQAMAWLDALTSPHTMECVPNTGHNVPGSDDGLETMLPYLTTGCTLQP